MSKGVKTRWSIDLIKEFVEMNSKCELLSKTYRRYDENLEFRCKCGQSFKRTFRHFKDGSRQCRKCSDNVRSDYKRWDINEVKKFVDENSECELISGEYINMHTKMLFKCGCNNPFEVSFNKFLRDSKRQCNSCGFNKSSELQRLDFEEVKRFIEIDSDSGCTLLGDKYINANESFSVSCPCGEEFNVTWRAFNYNNQRKCEKCSNRIQWDYEKVKKYIEIESETNCILLSMEYTNNTKKLLMKCGCSEEFEVSLSKFMGGQTRCNKCVGKESNIEFFTRTILEGHKVNFDQEKYIYYQKTKLYLDFLVSDIIAIECDGEQHFRSVDYFGGVSQFFSRRKNDQLKNNYCIQNNIPLIRIPYWEFNNIENILDHALGCYNLIEKSDVDRELVHKFLVNHPDWSHERYISQEPKK